MLFEETSLKDAFLLRLNRSEDSRGFFARSFCKKEFATHGLDNDFVQCNISYNLQKGTLRGLHYQAKPHEETKVVYCCKGAIFDVIVDLRLASVTYGKWQSFKLTAENRDMLYIPKGFAHGFQTLCDDTELFYLMGNYYDPGSAHGIRWNDPLLAIDWPIALPVMSEKDQMLPLFQELK